MVKKGILEELRARGLVKQVVFEDELRELLDTESQSFYIGFDPTADSLHVGHFMQMIVAKRLQDLHQPKDRHLRKQTVNGRKRSEGRAHALRY